MFVCVLNNLKVHPGIETTYRVLRLLSVCIIYKRSRNNIMKTYSQKRLEEFRILTSSHFSIKCYSQRFFYDGNNSKHTHNVHMGNGYTIPV